MLTARWSTLFIPERRSQFAHHHLMPDDLWIEGMQALHTHWSLSAPRPWTIRLLIGPPLVGTHSFEGISPLWPSLPGKAIRLFFSTSPRTLVSKIKFGAGYRGLIWHQCDREWLAESWYICCHLSQGSFRSSYQITQLQYSKTVLWKCAIDWKWKQSNYLIFPLWLWRECPLLAKPFPVLEFWIPFSWDSCLFALRFLKLCLFSPSQWINQDINMW